MKNFKNHIQLNRALYQYLEVFLIVNVQFYLFSCCDFDETAYLCNFHALRT